MALQKKIENKARVAARK